ncbi:MAG: DUF6273 domain-containing protein [Candidatus Coproplasma sp.]
MKSRKNRIFSIIMCIILAVCVSLSACNIDIGFSGSQSISLTDESGVCVSGVFDSGVRLVVEELSDEGKAEAIAGIANQDYLKDAEVYVYDISVVKDNVKVQPSGKAKVTVPVAGLDTTKQYKVFHVKDNGAVETLTAQTVNGKIEFETGSFSYFIVAEEDTRAKVQVSINILPLAAYGTLKVNGETYAGAASYKTAHYEGDQITVEAIAAEGRHFVNWLNSDDTVLSEELEYKFTVAKSDISVSAIFTDSHVVKYVDVTEDSHTEICKYGDYSNTVEHAFVNEEIITEATCQHTGEKLLTCACGKTKTETIPVAAHNYEDGLCTVCGAKQLYRRVNLNGTENPQGAYLYFGKYYSDRVESEETCAELLAKSGDPTTAEGLANWTAYDFGDGKACMYYCDVEGESINYRGVYIKEYRDNNTSPLSKYGSYTEQYCNGYYKGNIYWFYERDLLWAIENYKDGVATLRTEYVWDSQPFHNSDSEEVTYANSWIRSWLLSQLDSIFTQEQQEILIPNADCFNDKICLPSESELTPVNNYDKNVYGYNHYTKCMGIFQDTNNSVYRSPYWLRDGIVKTEDGKNYAKCITSRNPFDETASYIVTQTCVGVVPTIRIAL